MQTVDPVITMQMDNVLVAWRVSAEVGEKLKEEEQEQLGKMYYHLLKQCNYQA